MHKGLFTNKRKEGEMLQTLDILSALFGYSNNTNEEYKTMGLYAHIIKGHLSYTGITPVNRQMQNISLDEIKNCMCVLTLYI